MQSTLLVAERIVADILDFLGLEPDTERQISDRKYNHAHNQVKKCPDNDAYCFGSLQASFHRSFDASRVRRITRSICGPIGVRSTFGVWKLAACQYLGMSTPYAEQ